jgi:phosphate transport system substrate-binding protein
MPIPFGLRTVRSFVPALALLAAAGCFSSGSSSADKPRIQNKGSDTMIEVTSAWAEHYTKASVEAAGGGSGVGITALKDGTCDIANSSRQITPEEAATIKAKNNGKDPVEFVVGYDGLALYVHKDNPLEEVTMDQIREVFAEGGKITKWSDFGVTVPGCASSSIVCISRANNSGTYHYFKEAVLGKKADYRLSCQAATGSRDLVERVGNTPCAMGYSGMAYKTDQVKFLKVKDPSGKGVTPTAAAVLDKSYPIARPLFMYTVGEPSGPVKDYLAWIRSDAGQKVIEDIGYVPLPMDLRANAQ